MRTLDNRFFGSDSAPDLPTPTLDPPTRVLKGRVSRINYTRNPISVSLENGTTWNMTKGQWDYLLHQNKGPHIGSRVQIEIFADGGVKSVNVLGV